MEAVVDQAGWIVLPKSIRGALGLLPGTKVDTSPYGAGVQVVPADRIVVHPFCQFSKEICQLACSRPMVDL